jgi:hypothetical protein
VRTLRFFGLVLAVILGANSDDLYKDYKEDVIDAYKTIQPRLETLAETNPGQLVCAKVLRSLQLRFQEYWTEL